MVAFNSVVLFAVCIFSSADAFYSAPQRMREIYRSRTSHFSTEIEEVPFNELDDYYEDGMVPGKINLDDDTLAKQQAELEKLARQWRRERLDREIEESKVLGWTPAAEIINGRFSMFFITVGFLTELWTGQSLPQQVETMASVLGLLPLDYQSDF